MDDTVNAKALIINQDAEVVDSKNEESRFSTTQDSHCRNRLRIYQIVAVYMSFFSHVSYLRLLW